MENPFFRNHWNYQPRRPRYVPSMMEIPIHRQTVPAAPKVVSIPVRFVESTKSRSDSAKKIQKVFRGFIVRKNVKKVLTIEREVNEIERTLANEETVESIRRDQKERVRFGEMLMNLLFRLDSVKGADSGIRNFRKAVIKKAIALQEKVDSIDSEAVDRSSGMDACGAREQEISDPEDGIPEHKNVSSAADIPNTYLDTCDDEIESANDFCNKLEKFDGVESTVSSIAKEGAIIEESTPSSSADDLGELKMPEEKGVEEEKEGRKQSTELLERMMVENKRMMEMMEQLFEKNEMQTRMLCSLSHRVDQLEKAFLYEALRRKKKRSAAIVDTSEKCSKTKRCETVL